MRITEGAPWALLAALAMVATPAQAEEQIDSDEPVLAAAGEDESESTAAESDAEPAATVEADLEEEDEDEEGTDDAAAALGAANPVVAADTGKPWQLMGRVGLSLGSSTFTRNQETQVGYNVGLTGLYRIAPFLEGRLDAFARVAFDQVVDEGFGTFGASSPNQFFFRDIRLGVLGRGLYKWQDIGLTFGANTSIDLPTSDVAQRSGRILRWNLGVNAVDMIQKVGPGNLLVSAAFTFRKDFGDVNPGIDRISGDGSVLANCIASNQIDRDTCATDFAPLDFALIYGGSARYFLGKWSLGVGLTFFNNFSHSLNQSELEGTLTSGTPASDVRSSQFASDAPDHVMLVSAGIGLTYVINANFNVSLGLNHFGPLFEYEDGDNRNIWLPGENSELGFSSADISFTAMY